MDKTDGSNVLKTFSLFVWKILMWIRMQTTFEWEKSSIKIMF